MIEIASTLDAWEAIFHEIAHAVTSRAERPHGAEWQARMLRVAMLAEKDNEEEILALMIRSDVERTRAKLSRVPPEDEVYRAIEQSIKRRTIRCSRRVVICAVSRKYDYRPFALRKILKFADKVADAALLKKGWLHSRSASRQARKAQI